MTRSYLFLLDVPFAERAIAQAAGASWDGEVKAYVFQGTRLPRALEPYRASAYSWEEYREHDLNEHARVVRATPVGVTPRPHQVEAIKAISAAIKAKRHGFLLADDVGLGKTISAFEAVRQMPGVNTVLIVCPLAVVAHWRTTIARMGDQGKRIVVMNYERLPKLFEAPTAPKGKRPVRKRTQNKRLATKGSLAVDFDVVILDEAHKCRNPQSMRSKLCAKLVQQAQFVLWLSATAGQNPLELSYLAPLLAEVTGAKVKDLADFEAWCQAQGIGVSRGAYGKWEWNREAPTAERDLTLVRELLFEGRTPAGLRRRPEQIAGWPEMHRIMFPVALDAEARGLYNRTWREFRAALRLAQGKRDSKNALVARLRFRQKASLLRTAGTVALAEELLEQGYQVAISVTFMESLEAIRTALVSSGVDVAVIHGELKSATAKERERVRFQRGDAPVVLYTVEEGISLHAGEVACGGNRAPRANLAHDCRQSAVAAAQVEGRCHRDGQHATAYYLYGEDTVEEQIVGILVERLRTMKTMIGDDTETLRAIEALLDREAAASTE